MTAPRSFTQVQIRLDSASQVGHRVSMADSITWGDFAQGIDLPINEHHTVTIKPNATVEVRDAAGTPAADQPVIVRGADGTERPYKTNAHGRLFLYSMDPKAKFEVRLDRRAKQISE